MLDKYFEKSPIVNEIKNECREGQSVILYGCGALGSLAFQVFKTLGIEVFAYIDRDEDKQKTTYNGCKVYSLEEAETLSKDLPVLICIYDGNIERKVREELKEFGFNQFIDKNKIIQGYLSLNIKPLAYRIEEGEIIAVSPIAVIITEICSLNCRYCSHFIPYRANKRHFDKRQILDEIEMLTEIIKRIDIISLYGGEGLLHPDIYEICDKAAGYKNIGLIDILTNGTVLPSNEFMSMLASHGKFRIRISDYGDLNYKSKDIEALASKYNVQVIYEKFAGEGETHWFKPEKMYAHHRSQDINMGVYCSCTGPEICPMVAEGKLYKCGTSMIGERMGWVPEEKMDVINLLDRTKTVKEKKKQFIEFVLSDKALEACDYCFIGKQKAVAVAEQLMKGEGHSIEEAFI